MWQKQLKQIKKHTPEPQKVTIISPIKVENKVQEMSFSEYCKILNIQPIQQDRVINHVKAISPYQTDLVSSILTKHQTLELFDEHTATNEFFRFGQRNLPKELRLNKYKFTTVIDLHNYTKAHALDILAQFITSNPPSSCIKIIHGQGTNSEYNQPILLGAIRRYLSQLPNILAYSYGAPNQGGNGVTIVKLTS